MCEDASFAINPLDKKNFDFQSPPLLSIARQTVSGLYPTTRVDLVVIGAFPFSFLLNRGHPGIFLKGHVGPSKYILSSPIKVFPHKGDTSIQ